MDMDMYTSTGEEGASGQEQDASGGSRQRESFPRCAVGDLKQQSFLEHLRRRL